jgi:hypothetical protein
MVDARKRILVLRHDRPLLRACVLLLEHHGFEVTSANSVIQMILKLEAGEGCFDLLMVECSRTIRENPQNFVRFVSETQSDSLPALMLSGVGAREVLEVARQEGLAATLQPYEVEEWLSVLKEMLNGQRARFVS